MNEEDILRFPCSECPLWLAYMDAEEALTFPQLLNEYRNHNCSILGEEIINVLR